MEIHKGEKIMKDFTESLIENGMVAKIPIEYAEYLQTKPKELVFHDPENEEQAKIASRIKLKTLILLTLGGSIILFLFIYVIVTKNSLLVISLMGLMVVIFMIFIIRTAKTKPQVAIGRAIAKQKKLRNSSSTRNQYSHYVTITVDKPEKAIHSMIPVSKKVYERVEEGMKIMVVNSSGQGIILD